MLAVVAVGMSKECHYRWKVFKRATVSFINVRGLRAQNQDTPNKTLLGTIPPGGWREGGGVGGEFSFK